MRKEAEGGWGESEFEQGPSLAEGYGEKEFRKKINPDTSLGVCNESEG